MADGTGILTGLGQSVDLIYDMHPACQAPGFMPGDDTRFCFPMPYRMPTPSVEPGSIDRAAFVGNITWFNFGRAIWWAEMGRRGLPVDMLLTDYSSTTTLRSYGRYVDLLAGHRMALNFGWRESGVPIITGRTIETPMVGGCLVEETCPDTSYFMTEGEHFLTFATLDDLEQIIGDILPDADRCRAIGAAGKAHVDHYFSGSYFWAGLLSRLW